MRNKKVEEFFLEFLPEHEDVKLSQCHNWLSNYYLELEGVAFQNEDFLNQDDRIEAMFPGLPAPAANLCKFKAYSHRATDHQEAGNEKRISDLEASVSGTEYQQFTAAVWWMG